VAEAAVPLLGDQGEPRRLVDAPRRHQYVVGPQRDPAIADAPREADAFVDQTSADAETARCGLDQQQAQLGDLVGLPDQEHRADDRAIALDDPAALALGIEVGDELAGDLGDQRLEALVPTIFLGIDDAVAMDHPADVAGLVRPQQIGLTRRPGPAEQALDRLHRGDQATLRRRRQPRQHGADLLARAFIERREGGASGRGQRQQALPSVGVRRSLGEQAAPGELGQDAAQITGIERQLAGQLGRAETPAQVGVLRQLIEHARLGQRKFAGEQPLLQHADPLGVEAVEAPHHGDGRRQLCHRSPPDHPMRLSIILLFLATICRWSRRAGGRHDERRT